jgi:uncharacterized glyoxalase superfamily protein PhnB
MTLRFEIFPPDLDAAVDFYTRVLGFSLTSDGRTDPAAYVSMQRGGVRVVAGERNRVAAAGWPLEEDLQGRPWGLTDFRILDPAGYYLRITSRAG